MRKWLWKWLVPKGLKALYYANRNNRAFEKATSELSKDVNWNAKTKLYDHEKAEYLYEEETRIKPVNEYKPIELDPNAHQMFPMQETVMVKSGERSPADMLATRIGNEILRQGLCTVSKSAMAGGYDKYVIEVVIAKKK